MTAKGKVLGHVSNYATEEQVLAVMLEVLKKHPQYDVAAREEASELDPLKRARILIDLQRHDQARQVLLKVDSAAAYFLLGRLARFDNDWETAEQMFARVADAKLADDVRMERAYRHWQDAKFELLVGHLKDFPKESDRYSEARYYEGLALFHLDKRDEAMQVWKSTITACSQDPWIYRADWAYTTIKRGGKRGVFSSAGPKNSLLGRIGYMGRSNPDLKKRTK